MSKLNTVVATLQDSVFKARQTVNRKYMESLDCRRLMASYYAEAGLTSNREQENVSIHYGGWEEPEQQVRGSFTGHYLSAASMLCAAEGDGAFRARADFLVDELERCGREHLDGWCMSIPQLWLDWIMRDKWVWAPQYMVHKTLMGLADAHRYAGSGKALETADRACTILYNRVRDYTRDEQDRMLRWETGGLMEVFADLYAATGDGKYRVLMEKYCRRELFDRLLAGEDALSDMHCNTTVPEAHGCARAFEVTGDETYRRMAEAFWRCGVEGRGALATGTQNSHELWFGADAVCNTERNQEFCTVYNLIRLADYLFRWSGDAKYADYIETALYNGALAQQHRETGANAYFLPLHAGAKKAWGSLTDAMYCCYGTTVQMQCSYGFYVFYAGAGEITLAQYIPAAAVVDGVGLVLEEQCALRVTDSPCAKTYALRISQASPSRFALKLRRPKWADFFDVRVGGAPADTGEAGGFVTLDRAWGTDETVTVTVGWPLRTVPLSPSSARRAFLWGPAVLAGLADGERLIEGDPENAGALLRAEGTIGHHGFPHRWDAAGQRESVRFMPLYDVTDEVYTVYYPVRKARTQYALTQAINRKGKRP